MTDNSSNPDQQTPDETQGDASRGEMIPVQQVEASVVSEMDKVSSQEPIPRKLFTPPIDIYGDENGLVLKADIPGVTVEGLDLQIKDNKLTLFGRISARHPDQETLIHQEYQVGDFFRSFILSDEVDYDSISAKLNDGVLEIQLPRAPQEQPRKIQVETN